MPEGVREAMLYDVAVDEEASPVLSTDHVAPDPALNSWASSSQ